MEDEEENFVKLQIIDKDLNQEFGQCSQSVDIAGGTNNELHKDEVKCIQSEAPSCMLNSLENILRKEEGCLSLVGKDAEIKNLNLLVQSSLRQINNLKNELEACHLEISTLKATVSNLTASHSGVQAELETKKDSVGCDVIPIKIDQNCRKNLFNNEENSHLSVVDDNHSVQIQADKKEIKRRISAFSARKRKEVNDCNVREFCSRPVIEEENPLWVEADGCARLNAVFVPRRGSKSHIKVTKVCNEGVKMPLVQNIIPGDLKAMDELLPSGVIEERLQRMESYLKLTSDSSVRGNFYGRLKQLENRILYLESSSPEYLSLLETNACSPQKKQRKAEQHTSLTSNDTFRLHRRLQMLKEELKQKSKKMNSKRV